MKMHLKYCIFMVIIGLLLCDSLKDIEKVIFKSENYARDVVSNNECNRIYYDIILKNDFICIYQNNANNKNMNFTSGIASIFIDVIELFKINIMNEFKDNNELKNIYKNFMLVYLLSSKPIKNLKSIFEQYCKTYLYIFYDKLYDYIQYHIIKDEISEEFILPIPSKIRYITINTINRYNDCLDFLQSLENSICISTNKNNIKEFIIDN